MYANGYFEQKRRSPASLAVVVSLHGAALAALMLYGTSHFVAEKAPVTHTFNVPIDIPPPPETPPPPPQPQQRQVQQQPDHPTVVQTQNPQSGPIAGPPTPPQPYHPPAPATGPTQLASAAPAIPLPIRRAAEVDPNFRAALQPPYPPIEERAQREGQVRVRITIGANGRVTAIDQLSATSDAFWRVTQRQALSRWRFRPATVDGRPVESTMLFTVTFRLPDA